MFGKTSSFLTALREKADEVRAVLITGQVQIADQVVAKKAIDDLNAQIDELQRYLDREVTKLAARLDIPLCHCTRPAQLVAKEPDGDDYVCPGYGMRYKGPPRCEVEILT